LLLPCCFPLHHPRITCRTSSSLTSLAIARCCRRFFSRCTGVPPYFQLDAGQGRHNHHRKRNRRTKIKGIRSIPYNSMTTRSSHSQTEEDDDEADHYGPSPHTCHHCSRTFPAAWTEDYTGLIVDLGLSAQESIQAARDGCDFYSQYAELLFKITSRLGAETVQILIKRRSESPAWGKSEPYLIPRPYLNYTKHFTALSDSVCYVVSPDAIYSE
jgi:hypothetical protein